VFEFDVDPRVARCCIEQCTIECRAVHGVDDFLLRSPIGLQLKPARAIVQHAAAHRDEERPNGLHDSRALERPNAARGERKIDGAACATLSRPRIRPPVARTAIGLSGVVNGIGTIAFTLFVDPTSAIITDQAIHGKRTVEEVRSMVFYLSLTAIIGSLLSQAILYPAGVIIEVVARFAAHVHL